MIIQIGMLIVGLYVIISGKFGIGEASYLEGRKARIAGLILLTPLLFTLCSVLLLSSAELTGGFVNSETLKRELGNTERGLWRSALVIALAYVNFHGTSRETKTRSGCLGPWLIVTSLGTVFVAVNYFNPNFRQAVSALPWAFVAFTVIRGLQIICCIAIWMWKKWGVFGYIAAEVTWLGINLVTARSNMDFVLGLSSVVVLVLLVKPKWRFFE